MLPLATTDNVGRCFASVVAWDFVFQKQSPTARNFPVTLKSKLKIFFCFFFSVKLILTLGYLPSAPLKSSPNGATKM